MATAVAIAPPRDTDAVSPPNPWLLGAIALVGCAVPVRSIALALMNDDVDVVQVALLDWITVPFILAGLVAWVRRPESRLGLLMIGGGFASGLSALQLTHVDALYTIGALFDILPAAFFLHVCLAFPDGRLQSRFERLLVAAAYAAAIGLQLVKIALGAFGPNSLLELWAWPAAATDVQHVQLLSLSAICLAGVGFLAARRRSAGRPRRRSLALLIDSFAVGLVMIAVLFVVGTFDGPAFREIQRATLVVIGISPIVFLLGLLDARLGRSAVGDLIVELRTDPAPADLRDALRVRCGIGRSPWSTGCPTSGPMSTWTADPWSCSTRMGERRRRSTERARTWRRWCMTAPSTRSPSCSSPSAPPRASRSRTDA